MGHLVVLAMVVAVLAATPSRKEEHKVRGSTEMALAATPSRKERHARLIFKQASHAISNPPPPQAGKGTGSWDRGSMGC